jgi:DivIVA domain-containing protein
LVVALDRQSIEKKDFPIGRRGYDPEAVDSHLTSIAEQVDDLRSSLRRRNDSLAEQAAEQVRAIVEASESSANQIRADAEKDARDIRREARAEAKQAREEATAQAGQYVSNVSAATGAMVDRLDAVEEELGNLLDTLRTSVTRASSDLQLLESHLTEVKDAVSPRHQFEPEEAVEEPPRAIEPEPASGIEEEILFQEEEESTIVMEEPPVELAPESGESEFTDDTEGARLIALNMALNGTPRDEVDRYLAENFELSDRAALIEEVYSSVEG